MDNDNLPMDEFGGLKEHCDSPARCSTSLFRLLCDVAIDARLLDEKRVNTAGSGENDQLTLWSNRPGQNATEANALALLSVWLVGGLIVGTMVQIPGRAWWGWPVAVITTPLFTFLGLQIYCLLAAVCAGAIGNLGVGSERTRERTVLWVSLSGLTVLAIIAVSWGGPFYLAAAVPWLLWASLNFFAWTVLLLRGLLTALRQ